MATHQHSSAVVSVTQRSATRQRVSLPARLTWKDQRGLMRFASVVTRDVSETGAFIESGTAVPISQFRLVHLELEGSGGSGTPLDGGRVLAAVWRVERDAAAHGSPQGYGLRFMVAPASQGAPCATTRELIAACA